MSFLVGLHRHGYAAVYDLRNGNTNVYDVGPVHATLTNLDNVLQKLCEYVQPTEVQRLVISHFLPYPPDLQLARQRCMEFGFKNVHFVYWMTTQVQAILNEKYTTLVENEHVLVTVRGNAEYTTLWHISNNVMKFVKSLETSFARFIVDRDSISNPDFVAAAREVIRTYGVGQWFVLDSPKTRDLIQRNNLAVDVVPWDQYMTPQQLSLVTLWTAQRRAGVVGGVLVGNHYLYGPQVEIDGIIICDKVSEGVAMPSQWSSNYVIVAKNITVNYHVSQWKFDFKTKESVQIQLRFDEDGILSIILMAQPKMLATANMAFTNDLMFLAASTTDAVSKPAVIGPFPTRLRFEKETVTISENASGKNILSGILKMLDPSNPAEPGWQLVNNHFSAKVCLPDGTDKNVDAQTAASYLLSFAVNKVSLPGEGLEKLFIVLPEDFTEIQCANLTAVAAKIGITATIKRELSAVADGYAKKQNLQNEDRIIVVHPTMEGCKLKLFKVSGQQTECEAEKVDANMSYEVLRQSQRKWEKRVHDSINPMDSGVPEAQVFQLEHSSYSVAKLTETWLEAFRSMLQSLVPDGKRDTVKGVVFVGALARRLTLLNNLLCWIFLSAEICTVVEDDLGRLAVIGAQLGTPTLLPRRLPNAQVTRLDNPGTNPFTLEYYNSRMLMQDEMYDLKLY